jgi:hypothetical protein
MTRIAERYRFGCRRCGERFEKQDWPPDSRVHLLATAVTLGLWLVVWAIWQWWLIYSLSRCPECGRRSRRTLITFLILLVLSGEVLWSYYYLIEIAPTQIAQRSANPEPLSNRENAIVFLSVTATQYGPFVLLGWFVFFSVVLLYMPNTFRVSGR